MLYAFGSKPLHSSNGLNAAYVYPVQRCQSSSAFCLQSTVSGSFHGGALVFQRPKILDYLISVLNEGFNGGTCMFVEHSHS